ncbi:hypothetical protein DESC_830035 [Desulfosarcina cetonica]|nr:hypothetical protein DESC_830035 [Desulfosarcina cetonica]
MTHADHALAHLLQDPHHMPAGLGLATAGAYGADRDDRALGGQHGVGSTDDDEIGAGGSHLGGLVHDLHVGHVTVGKGHQIDLFSPDQFHQLIVGNNRDALGIAAARQLGRIDPAVDIGNLGGGETDHFVAWVVAEVDIEIVKIPARGPHDDHFLDHAHLLGGYLKSARTMDRSFITLQYRPKATF